MEGNNKMKKVVKIGFAPTKRVPFNHPQYMEVRDKIFEAIKGWTCDGIIEVVDIADVTPLNILQTEDDVEAVVKKFHDAKVDGVFFPHCNFGCEAAVAGVARQLKVPVLLWGPRDDSTEDNGGSEFGVGVGRPRDSQCGLFASGKALRRVNVPFTYIPNTDIDDPTFKRGYEAFAAVCAAVRDFKETQILQVGTRPEPFWTVMINEGEILEKFGIRVLPVSNFELSERAKALIENEPERVKKACEMIGNTTKYVKAEDCEVASLGVDDHQIMMLGAYYEAMLDWSKELKCNAAAMQCWAAFRGSMGIAACGINGFLADAGLPVACETDIHGVIGTRLLQGACLYNSGVFFADLTVRHRFNENSELLWHCGNFPPSTAGDDIEKVMWQEGRTHFECRKGEPITIIRFDGDHGEYSMLIGEGKGVDGPRTGGTYSWCEVKDWVAWEDKIVKGPYIHHSCCAYGEYMPIVAEACMYLGIKADFADEGAEKACKEFWYGR